MYGFGRRIFVHDRTCTKYKAFAFPPIQFLFFSFFYSAPSVFSLTLYKYLSVDYYNPPSTPSFERAFESSELSRPSSSGPIAVRRL